jgi:hypothetical protein
MSRKVFTLAVLSVLTFTAQLAAADDTPPEPPRRRATAVALSAGGAALSIGVAVLGFEANNRTLFAVGALSSLVTPSAGEVYAGQLFTWGQGIRVVSGGLLTAGFEKFLDCGLSSGSRRDQCERNRDQTSTLLLGGVIGYGVGLLYDIATADSAVDRYNERYHLHVAPVMTRTAGSSSAIGVRISGSF